MGVKGALQAAIDESSINSTFDELSGTVITPGEGTPTRTRPSGGKIDVLFNNRVD